MTMPTPTTTDSESDTKEHAVEDCLEVARQRHARVAQRRDGEPREQADQKQDRPEYEEVRLHVQEAPGNRDVAMSTSEVRV